MKKPSRRLVVFSVVIAIVVVVVVIGIGAVKYRRMFLAAARTVRVYGEAIVDRNYQRAYRLGSRQLRANVSYEEFLKMNSKLEDSLGDPKSAAVYSVEIDDRGWPKQGWARVKAEVSYEKGVLPILFLLRYEDGEWAIFRFDEQRASPEMLGGKW